VAVEIPPDAHCVLLLSIRVCHRLPNGVPCRNRSTTILNDTRRSTIKSDAFTFDMDAVAAKANYFEAGRRCTCMICPAGKQAELETMAVERYECSASDFPSGCVAVEPKAEFVFGACQCLPGTWSKQNYSCTDWNDDNTFCVPCPFPGRCTGGNTCSGNYHGLRVRSAHLTFSRSMILVSLAQRMTQHK
jgi:hypothetical protein